MGIAGLGSWFVKTNGARGRFLPCPRISNRLCAAPFGNRRFRVYHGVLSHKRLTSLDVRAIRTHFVLLGIYNEPLALGLFGRNSSQQRWHWEQHGLLKHG